MARGSITPRPTNDGKVRYRIKWESRGPDGSRRHHSATRGTKDAADSFLAEKLDDVHDGTFVLALERNGRAIPRAMARSISSQMG